MSQKVQQTSENKTDTGSQLKQGIIESPSPGEFIVEEPAGQDYVSHLFAHAAAAGGPGGGEGVDGGDTPTERLSSLLTGPLLSQPANHTPRNQSFLQLQQTLGNRYVQRMMDNSLIIGQPDDKYEQEADRIAGRVMRMPACPGCSEEVEQVTPLIQRQTDFEEEEDECPGCTTNEGTIQMQVDPDKEEEEEEWVQAKLFEPVEEKDGSTTGGTGFDLSTRLFFEQRFGCDFSTVRIHTDSRAGEMNRQLHSRAFTHKNDIYFREGHYRPGTPGGRRLIAHELTHVLQQGAGSEAVPAVQRDWKDTAGEIWSATGGRVVSGVREGAEFLAEGAVELYEEGVEALQGLVERWAPGLLSFLRGDIVTNIKERVITALDARLGGLITRVQEQGVVDFLVNTFRTLFQTVVTASGELSGSSCSALIQAAQAIFGFAKSLAGPAFKFLGRVVSNIADFFNYIATEIVRPAFDAIKEFAGDAWEWITSTADWLWEITEPLRREVLRAWNWIKSTFNLAWTTAGSILEWFSEKAVEAWNRVKAFFQPILGPLKMVWSFLLMISPLGPILLIWKGLPYLWDGLKWLIKNILNSEIVAKAVTFLAEEVLPAVIKGINELKSLMAAAYAWLTGLLSAVAAAARILLAAIQKSAVFRFFAGVVRSLQEAFNQAYTMVSDFMGKLVNAVSSALSWLWKKIKPIWLCMVGIGFLIGSPPLWPVFIVGLAARIAWELLPDCIKIPVVDLLLDFAVWAIQSIPPSQVIGPLWPICQRGMLSFLKRVQALSPDEKILFIEKALTFAIAPNFYAGLFLGVVKGFVWDGFIGLFMLLWQLISGIPRAIAAIYNFFKNLMLDIESIRYLIDRAVQIRDRVLAFIQSPDAIQQIVEFIKQSPSMLFNMVQTAYKEGMEWAQRAGEGAAETIFNFVTTTTAYDLGLKIGTVIGYILFEVVLFFASGSIGNAAKWVGKGLAWIGKGVRMMATSIARGGGLIAKAFRFIRRLVDAAWEAARKIGEQLRHILQDLRNFIDDLIRWFMQALERALGKVPGVGRYAGKWARSQLLWIEFKMALRMALLPFQMTGITRLRAGEILETVRRRFRRVARRGVGLPVVKEDGFRVLRAQKGSIPFMREVARVPMDERTRWEEGKEAIRDRMSRIRDDERSKRGIESILNRKDFKDRFKYNKLKVEWDEPENDWNIMGSMSPLREITEVENSGDLHTGTWSDPIPIQWYKRPNDYTPVTMVVENQVRTYGLHAWQTLPHPIPGRDPIRIGILPEYDVRSGEKLQRTRVGEKRTGIVQERYRNALEDHQFNWSGKDADHVMDLGMGGDDRYSNVYPLDSGINRRGFEGGYYNTMIIYKKRARQSDGRMDWESEEKTLSRLSGKWFVVRGYQYPPPGPMGRD